MKCQDFLRELNVYDARGREKHHYWLRHDGAPDSSTPAITRLWDDANQLTSIANVWSAIDYGYDEAGQPKWERSNVVGAVGGPAQVSYHRFPSGEVSQTIYPNGTSVQQFFTARGQLKHVGWGAGATSYVYHPDGKVNSQLRTNGVTTSYGYNGRGMIGSLAHTNGSNQSLAYREYWRDERDRITAWIRGSGGGLNGMEDGRGNRYKYDAEGQLERAWYRARYPWTENPEDPKRGDHFHYDELGNRKDWNDVANRGAMLIQRKNNGLNQYYSWENSYPNPPQHWGTTTNYDADLGGYWGMPGQANGVLMEDGYISAGFNALNQPMSIWSKVYPRVPSPQYMHFGYDPLGRCVKRWKSTGEAWAPGYNPATYYYYDGWNLVQEGSSAATAERVYVHGGRVDEIVASQVSGAWYNHHYDAQGNCILLTTADGGLQEQYDYDAFGYPYFYSASGLKAGNVKTRFLFTGREWISDLKLYDYRNRMYQPELGRFLQPDPIQFKAGDYNLYRYCHNDPINKTDPLGLVPGDPFGSPQDAARDVHRFINPTSIKQNAEYGSVIYQVGNKFYASPTFTNSAQTHVTLGTEVDKSQIPKEARSQATRVGDYHSHGDYSKNLINPKDGTSKIVRASKSENPESDHPSPEDKQRAGIIQGKVPSYRLFLGTPSGAVKEYDSKKEKPL